METLAAWRCSDGLAGDVPRGPDALVARLQALDASLASNRRHEREVALTARANGPQAWALASSERRRTAAAAEKTRSIAEDLLASRAEAVFKLQRGRDTSCVAMDPAAVPAFRNLVEIRATVEHINSARKAMDEAHAQTCGPVDVDGVAKAAETFIQSRLKTEAAAAKLRARRSVVEALAEQSQSKPSESQDSGDLSRDADYEAANSGNSRNRRGWRLSDEAELEAFLKV